MSKPLHKTIGSSRSLKQCYVVLMSGFDTQIYVTLHGFRSLGRACILLKQHDLETEITIIVMDIVISWHSLPMLFTVLNKEKDSVPLSYNIQDGGGKG